MQKVLVCFLVISMSAGCYSSEKIIYLDCVGVETETGKIDGKRVPTSRRDVKKTFKFFMDFRQVKDGHIDIGQMRESLEGTRKKIGRAHV